ncbi:SDR family oxidoreductase [Stappia sp. F7233]|uniref:SDR family oxidoreductase n=1 Tax=Stappia albiluteola TaxID=2758565 RepID=A0A839AA75_9HYPH|nr:SDR family oxidoreductase [Stappia albiluteola]MBA5775842.1 SDR family oxidoreductase [Stappia albiluteola]
MSSSRLFIFGLGYSSRAFVEEVKDRFDWIGGTTRSADKAAALRPRGIEPFIFDGATTESPDPAIAEALASATHILLSIAPDERGDPVLRLYSDAIAASRPRWIGYLSTVGVYGDHDGGWVDEETVLKPVSRRSVLRAAAEQSWLDFAGARLLDLMIFRLAGIYGPGRNALVNLEAGTARRLVKPGQVFNRIHVADIAGALAASLRDPSRRIYNVCDDEPSPPQDVVAYAAGLLGIEPPPEVAFEDADLSPMARSFYGENKRVSNCRLKSDLGYTFRFPTYREALDALHRDGWR